ncbi:MATE family efflux transporter [Bacillus atrophaeus]|nr:MATE family efflux transporter [Bacillus atrophaeus]
MKYQEKMQQAMFGGPIIPTIIRIAVPILISNLFNYIYLLTDTYFISMLDPSSSAPLSGTGLLYPLFFIFMSVASSFAVGLSIVTGRLIGEKKYEECKSLGISAVLTALALSIPFIIVCYTYGNGLVNILAGNELSSDAATYGLHYLYALAPGLIFMVIAQVYGGILLGEGLAFVTAIAFMFMTLLNIVLNPVLMFVLNMGVVGSGLATTISLCFACLFILRFIQTGRSRIPLAFSLFRFNKTIVKEIVRFGLPQFLITVSFYVIVVVYNKVITTNFNENAMNAWTLTERVDQILIIPIIAVGGAVTVFVSQNFGRNQLDRIKKALNVNMGFVFAICTVLALIYVFLASWLFSKFTVIPEVVELATKQALITAFTFGFMAISWVIGSFFQATGRPLPAVIVFYTKVAITIALGLYFTRVVNMGMEGIFISVAIGNVLSLPFAFFWIKRHLKNIKFKSVLDKDNYQVKDAGSN